MSDLNLIPNPKVLMVNTSIFLANLVIMKKLFMDPYLAVRDKRYALTNQQHGTAAELIAQSNQLEAKIKQKMDQALADARLIRAESKEKADRKREEILSAAHAAAKKTIAEATVTTAAILKSERAKLPQIVNQLATALYTTTVN